MTDQTRASLDQLVDFVEARLSEIDDNDGSAGWWDKQNDKIRATIAELERGHGASFHRISFLHSLTIAGVSGASTSSRLGVLRDWCANARRRTGKERAA